MKSKNRAKTRNPFESTQLPKKSKIKPFSSQNFHKIIPKKNFSTKILQNPKNKQSKIIPKKKMLIKSKSQINNEDSSTNFLSGFNEKKIFYKKTRKDKINPNRKSESESFFINFKLGEKDSFMESIFKSRLKINENENNKKINLKNNFDYCRVNKDSGKNENDSLEIYDFNDETNVKYVLKNLSTTLSCDKSDVNNNLSNIFEELNEENWDNDEGKDKIINDIKIFEVNKNLVNLSQKI